MTNPERNHAVSALPSGAVVHTWTAGSSRGSVVLQHGFGEYAERYVEQHARLVPRLLEAGYDVWALDLWGHGRSPGRRAVTSVRLAVADHLAVRRKAAAGGRPVILAGHSLGGLISACSASASPAELCGVVLMSPALPAPEPDLTRRALGAVAAFAPGLPIPRHRRPVSELSRLASVGERAAADPLMFDGQVPVLLAATALDEAARLTAGQRTWRLPALLVHGTADTYADPANARAFMDGIAAEDTRIQLFPGAFHELLNDLCADEVLDLVVAWMDAHLPGQP